VPIWFTFSSSALQAAWMARGLLRIVEQIVAHDERSSGEHGAELRPTLPIVLGQSVLDADDRKSLDPTGQVRDHFVG
jgi:hypothetical protein